MKKISKWQNSELSFEGEDEFEWKKYIPYGVVALVILILIIILIVVNVNKKGKDDLNSEIKSSQITEVSEIKENSENIEKNKKQERENEGEAVPEEALKEDPQNAGMMGEVEQGSAIDVSNVITGSSENSNVTIGIDVARYQGTIDWAQVAATGIDFAMIRVGYRTTKTGEIYADTNARYNMQEASKYGIKIGAYFFSSAINYDEALEEAEWVANYISRYNITYPVAYDCENFDVEGSRQGSLTKSDRTAIAKAFMEQIRSKGYTPMFYGSANALANNAKWDTSSLDGSYKIWVAQYPSSPYPQTSQSSYAGQHAMWQYTNNGSIAGIKGAVDVNVAYFGYDQVSEKKSNEDAGTVGADVEANMKFTDVNEVVTAKDEANLRSNPEQGTDSNIVYLLKNGEQITRTGISNSGWSRVDYNGQRCYVVSSLITTDLNYKPKQDEPKPVEETTPVAPKEEPIANVNGLDFYGVEDVVTPKEETNLRTAPLAGDEYIAFANVPNGAALQRVAYTKTADANGWYWSKVIYEGQELYCLTTLVKTYTGN